MTAYLSIEEANAYHNLRMSKAAWAALDEEEKARRLVSASDFLDVNYRFMGEKADPMQLRQFPRKGFVWGSDLFCIGKEKKIWGEKMRRG